MTIIAQVGDIRETLSCWSNLYPVYLCQVTDPCVRGSSSVSREDDVKMFLCIESAFDLMLRVGVSGSYSRDSCVQEFSHGLSYVSTIGASLSVASLLAINSTALSHKAGDLMFRIGCRYRNRTDTCNRVYGSVHSFNSAKDACFQCLCVHAFAPIFRDIQSPII